MVWVWVSLPKLNISSMYFGASSFIDLKSIVTFRLWFFTSILFHFKILITSWYLVSWPAPKNSRPSVFRRRIILWRSLILQSMSSGGGEGGIDIMRGHNESGYRCFTKINFYIKCNGTGHWNLRLLIVEFSTYFLNLIYANTMFNGNFDFPHLNNLIFF